MIDHLIREGIEDGTRCKFCKELNANCDCDDAFKRIRECMDDGEDYDEEKSRV